MENLKKDFEVDIKIHMTTYIVTYISVLSITVTRCSAAENVCSFQWGETYNEYGLSKLKHISGNDSWVRIS